MAAARSHALVHAGELACVVTIDAEVSDGLPEAVFVGVSASDLREARDRVRAAIINSGECWPQGRITISLTLPKQVTRISSLDLAIAVAILAAAGDLPGGNLADTLFVAELGLDGRLRPVPSIAVLLAGVYTAGLPQIANDGIRTVVVPLEDTQAATEAVGLIPVMNLRALGATGLADVLFWLRGSTSLVNTTE